MPHMEPEEAFRGWQHVRPAGLDLMALENWDDARGTVDDGHLFRTPYHTILLEFQGYLGNIYVYIYIYNTWRSCTFPVINSITALLHPPNPRKHSLA